MRFQIQRTHKQMLLVAAICAVLIHGAFSAPSPSNVEDDLPSASDNEDSDENPILIFAAKILVKQVGCAIAVRHARNCGVRELPIPLERLPEEDEIDQSVADILRSRQIHYQILLNHMDVYVFEPRLARRTLYDMELLALVSSIHSFNLMPLDIIHTFLVGAVAVLLTFNGAESFTLGRNVSTISLDLDDHVDSSNETNGRDDHLDSLELIQNNETSIEDVLDIHQHHNSLETNNRRFIKQDFKLALLNQTTNASLVLVVTDDDNLSLEDIAFLEQQKNKTNDTINHHQQLHLLIDTLKVKSDLVKRNAPTDPFVIQQQDGLSSHGVTPVQQRFDDHSLEDQQHFVLSHEDILLLSVLEQQPIFGVFGHPLSDDLYLVKEYLGDYYFWEMDDELSRAYLMRWVMVKDITKLFGSNIMDTRPKKLTADHFAQFTPVLPMTDDEIHALSPMLLVAAICAVLFHGALSSPSPSNFDDDDLMMRSDNDNEDPDQNPILIYLAKRFIKKVGCKAAMKYATKKCGVPQPTTAVPQKRSPADAEDDDELDQSKLKCKAAKFITRFCK
uniref:Uncharacterized protein n=1 Tax=Daphnia galeata TaxID=27404 RepID=A0A8J2RA19_9CRUS|nr:unnamed protein product [Daphnia galeata]